MRILTEIAIKTVLLTSLATTLRLDLTVDNGKLVWKESGHTGRRIDANSEGLVFLLFTFGDIHE